MLKRLWVLAAKALLFFVLVWLLVIAYWQYTRRVVSSADLLIYLALLPIGLLFAYAVVKAVLRLGRWAHTRLQRQVVENKTTQKVANESLPSAIHNPDRAILVLAGAVCSGMGDAEMWIEKTRDYEIHHALDRHLTEALGFGVRSCRVDEIVVDEMPIGTRMALLRMDKMLSQVRDNLADVVRLAASYTGQARQQNAHADKRATLHPEWLGVPASAAVTEVTAKVTHIRKISDLTILLLLPDFVAPEEAKGLQSDCHQWALDLGWKREAVNVLCVVLQQPFDGMKKLSEIFQQQLQKPGRILTVFSAVSWLDEALLNGRLQGDRAWSERLYKATTIVGEAAAGMVVSNDALINPDTGEEHEALARLSLFSLGAREKPIDVKGSIEAELLTQMAHGQQAALGIDLAQIKSLVASGDHWKGRPVELGRWMSDCLPHMNLVDDTIHVGQHLGECEPLSDLLGLVLAVEHCRQLASPVLFCSNHSLSWRGMSVVMPVAAV